MEKVYETTQDNQARFALGELGKYPLIAFGVNCSTATDQKLDTTVTKVKRFAELKGFEGWLMLNLSPQRATNPEDMHEDLRLDWHQANLATIEKYLSQIHKPTIWAAWGQTIEVRSYLRDSLADIVAVTDMFRSRWVRAGKLTKSGHPRHPSRMAYDYDLCDFDIGHYIQII